MKSADPLSDVQRLALEQGRVALPRVLEWIDACLAEHASAVRPVSTLGYERLAMCFPAELLDATKLVEVDVVPFPPTMRLGLELLDRFPGGSFDGIAFRDTIFADRACVEEGLVFHELVHVVQWRVLGPERFLLAYGLGLVQKGYERSPLERMAYALQDRFEAGEHPPGVVEHIECESEAIWRDASVHLA